MELVIANQASEGGDEETLANIQIPFKTFQRYSLCNI